MHGWNSLRGPFISLLAYLLNKLLPDQRARPQRGNRVRLMTANALETADSVLRLLL